MRFHFLRDLTREGVVELVYCGTQDQLADVMTKPVTLDAFQRNSFKIVVAPYPKPTVPSDNSKGSSLVNHSITSKVPFPHRFMNSKKEQASKDMLENFQKVQVNILLLDAIQQIPSYVKFLKELCTKKRNFKENEIVALSEEVSALLRTLPPKLKI